MTATDPNENSNATQSYDLMASDLPAGGLPEWLHGRAQRHGDRVAVTYIDDDASELSWTYKQLWQHSCSVATQLAERDPESGPNGMAPRALLLYPPGIEFLAGFLGCQIAGWTPVPTCYPKAGREIPRLDSAADDCLPAAIIGDQATIESLNPDKLGDVARKTPALISDIDVGHSVELDAASIQCDLDSLALLQYTSGSTSEPKGVMVRQRNLMSNLEAIRRGFQINWQADDEPHPDSGVFWLPFFHDMGLIGGILEPLYVGGRAILMSPRSFLQRPIRWLQYISDHKALISGAPNFAYQLCVDRIDPEQADNLDLSGWKIAFSGAEPILPRTFQDFGNRFSSCGFSSSSFYPCFGLAEASLLAAGGDGPSEPKLLIVRRESLGEGRPEVVADGKGREFQELVCCGSAAHETDLVIVDPETCSAVDELVVGEIWLRGSSISSGYWNRDEENLAMFQAQLTDGTSGYCRTGDLGFMHERQLYVTGRLKDVVILRGRNLFPQDIETTVRETVGSDGGQCAAFAVQSPRGEALAIVAELPRRADEATFPELVRQIRRAVIDIHEVDPRHVLLVRQATVPLTSSGKVQRSRCRDLFDGDDFKTKFRYDRSSAGEQSPIPIPEFPASPTPADRDVMTIATETWMSQWLVSRAGVDPSEVELEKPFADYGLDSMTAVEMSGEIEDWSGVELTPVVAWNHPTVAKLSDFLVSELLREQAENDSNADAEVSEDELEGLLDEIELLSDDEIDHALADKPSS
jgi:acyl-CoA synthetase (AMP-forming)/AMP-acid ligase II/acyl carrier protein